MNSNVTLRQSYRYCARAARRSASSFYWSFWLLPREKRRAMYVMYAFSRRTDDIVDGCAASASHVSPNHDESGEVRQRLSDWRRTIENALAGRFDDPLLPALTDPLLPALADVVQRYGIPSAYLFDILDGVEMDLLPRQYETFDDLSQYCYRVASAVGLACIHIWGFDGDAAREPAVKCGLAFQLTNILRDLKEDAQRGRIYLPMADLRRFEYSAEELKRGVRNERLTTLLKFEIHRAEQLYAEAALLHDYLDQDGRTVFGAMMSSYRRLLDEIKRRDGNLFDRRVRLGPLQKIGIVASYWFDQQRRKTSPIAKC